MAKHRKTTTTAVRTVRRLGHLTLLSALVGTPAVVTTGAASAEPNWDAIAACESGGNWHTNTGNGFSGGLQFTPSTWRANGGTGSPQNASRAEQIRVANNVLASQGIGAWPVCGKRGGSSTPVVRASTPVHKAVPETIHRPSTLAHRASATSYTVVTGDTLSTIAAEHGVTGGWQALFQRNRAVVDSPDLIFVGQRLSL